jgi:DNA-directed RNA polymerase III subunit RPC2
MMKMDAPPPNSTLHSTSEDDGNEFHELYNDTLLNQPLKHLSDKWKLVPAFLRLRGLVKQHIDSFNYFLNVSIKEIIRANMELTSEHDHEFFLRFKDIRVTWPRVQDGSFDWKLMPHECRIRDMTYNAPIVVDIEYTCGKSITHLNDLEIGKMPMMLGASNCWLNGMSMEEMAKANECPYDPRGYFIINGVEKVLLI